MKDKHWKQKLQDKMAHYEEPAPDGLWESIERGLPVTENTAMGSGRRHISLWVGRLAAAAACIALTLLIGREWMNAPQRPTPTASEAQSSPTPPASATTVRQVPIAMAARTQPPLPLKATPMTDIDHETHVNVEEARQPETGGEQPEPERQAETATSAKRKQQAPANTWTWDRPARSTRKQTSSKLTASLYASGGPVDALSQRTYDLGFSPIYAFTPNTSSISNAKGEYADGLAENSAMVRTVSRNTLLNSTYTEYRNEVKHHLPLRGGISLRFALTDRLAVESGISYTRMTSDFHEGSPVNYFSTTQTLHYIGIPANMLYTLWKPTALELYVLGGGMVEKNVKGQSTTTYHINDAEINHASDHFTEKRLQWSVNGGIGIQYNLNHVLGLYAEPSASYYIDNHGSVSNYYKDKPLEFNLKVGLRYSFNR